MLLYAYLDHRKAKNLAYIKITSVPLYVEKINVELSINRTGISCIADVLRLYKFVWFVAISVFAHFYSEAKKHNKEMLYVAN